MSEKNIVVEIRGVVEENVKAVAKNGAVYHKFKIDGQKMSWWISKDKNAELVAPTLILGTKVKGFAEQSGEYLNVKSLEIDEVTVEDVSEVIKENRVESGLSINTVSPVGDKIVKQVCLKIAGEVIGQRLRTLDPTKDDEFVKHGSPDNVFAYAKSLYDKVAGWIK